MIPQLPANVREPCAAIPSITGRDLAALIEADAALALDYARCREKHRAAIEAYDKIRRAFSPAEGSD